MDEEQLAARLAAAEAEAESLGRRAGSVRRMAAPSARGNAERTARDLRARMAHNAAEAERLRAELRARQAARADEDRMATAQAAQEAGVGSIEYSRWLRAERDRLDHDAAGLLRRQRSFGLLLQVTDEAPRRGFVAKAATIAGMVAEHIEYDGTTPLNVADALDRLAIEEPLLTTPLTGGRTDHA